MKLDDTFLLDSTHSLHLLSIRCGCLPHLKCRLKVSRESTNMVLTFEQRVLLRQLAQFLKDAERFGRDLDCQY